MMFHTPLSPIIYAKLLGSKLAGEYQPLITATGMLKGDGNGGVSAAVAGTDYDTASNIVSATAAMTPEQAAQTRQNIGADTPETVTEWLDAHVDPDTGYVIDNSLTVEGAAADAKATGDAVGELKSAVDNYLPEFVPEYVDGKYVRYDTGGIDVGNGWKYVTFPVYEGETFQYNYTRTSPDTRGLAFYNAFGTFIAGSGVQAIATAQTVTVPANAVTCKASFVGNPSLVILKTNVFEIKEAINTADKKAANAQNSVDELANDVNVKVPVSSFSEVATSYIRDTGVIGNDSEMTVDYFRCEKNSTYEIEVTEQLPNFRASLSTTVPNQNVQTYDVIRTGGMKITIKTDDSANFVVFHRMSSDSNFSVNHIISKAEYYATRYSPLYAFTNITCIGDSLTHGVVTTDSQGGYRIAKYPYPAVIGRMTGATIEEIAHGGYNASDWWDAYADRITSKTNQLAMVFLGTNDGLTDTVATDCAGDDYTTFADTNTGNYGKIVGKLKSVGAKIILLQCFTGDGVLSNTNKAIKDIADKFGCGLIATKRLLNPAYHYYPDLSGSDSLHFNDLGYSAFADFIFQQISTMDSNYLKFIIPQ